MKWEALKAMCHVQAHKAQHDPDDILFTALTRRDVWLVLYGLLCASDTAPDLEDLSCDLRLRLAELVDCQKDGWKSGEETA